ncbi:MAG: hypothetical protein R3D29_09205 [Nitratireductor sp.]
MTRSSIIFRWFHPDIKPHLTSTSVHVQLEATLADGGLCIPYTHGEPVSAIAKGPAAADFIHPPVLVHRA